jgi:hypothetical protein
MPMHVVSLKLAKAKLLIINKLPEADASGKDQQ